MVAAASVVGIWMGEGGDRRRIAVLVLMIMMSVLLRHGSFGGERTTDGHGVDGCRRNRVLVVAIVVAVLGLVRSEFEWRAVGAVREGPFSGEARVIGDSKPIGQGRRVVLEIEGQRFETWVFGSKRARVSLLAAGDLVMVEGERKALDGERVRRFQIRHIVGRFDMSNMSTAPDGERRNSALVRVANRVRESIRQGAADLPVERSALFTGLVYGDDSGQPPEMIERFRASGLAHLTAVSGQNVVFVLAMLGPLLTRLRRTTRVGLTVVVLACFAIMTRLEPSVVRAVFMAGVSTVSVAFGRPVTSWVALCATVSLATLVDPFLVWSVGWWLSVAGCLGLINATRPLTRLLSGGPRWMSSWLAPTIAAQTGVLIVIVRIFGWPSAMSIPCNLLAAPVAGIVMLVGLPTAVIAGLLPGALSLIAMWPISAAVAWVDGVAAFGAQVELPAAVDAGVATCSAVVVVWALIHAGRPVSRHAGRQTSRHSS